MITIGLLALLALILLLAHKKSVGRGRDNPKIESMQMVQTAYRATPEKVTLRRGTAVFVSNVEGRCYVVGFCDDHSILVKMPDGKVKNFYKIRLTVAPAQKE